MKRYRTLLICGLLGGWLTGCVAGDPLPSEAEEIPVVLHAGSGSGTKAIVDEGDAFAPLLLCSAVAGEYSTLEWKQTVSVGTDGSVVYPGAVPVYPRYGAYIHIIGIYPADGAVADGEAVFRADGQTDLMYAPELTGNRWDGLRIYGNSDSSKDRPLRFGHLLSQLQLTAIRTANDLAGKKQFRILSIRLKDIPGQATVRLGGVQEGEERVAWSDPGIREPVLSKDPADSDKNNLIDSTDPDNPDAVGWILLPPAEYYEADITTTVGNFDNIIIRPDEGAFIGGLAHKVILTLNDRSLSVTGVTKEDWTNEDGGEVVVD